MSIHPSSNLVRAVQAGDSATVRRLVREHLKPELDRLPVKYHATVIDMYERAFARYAREARRDALEDAVRHSRRQHR
jgi:hypothetical protein